MGKKKNKTEKAKPTEPPEPKAQKTYSYAAEAKGKKGGEGREEDEGLPKVQIPVKMEATILSLILDHKRQQNLSGTASFRITTKKLTDLYMSLSQTGFRHAQIEAAMSATIQYGGDLEDALDWLCLNTPNDQLPGGFSQSLADEDKKKRPKFTAEQTSTLCEPPASSKSQEPAGKPPPVAPPVADKPDVKSWILQYADQSSDEDQLLDDTGNVKPDPNKRYREVAGLLLDARTAAVQAKSSGDKAASKSAGRKVREFMIEMETLERDPHFNPSNKISDLDLQPAPVTTQAPETNKQTEAAAPVSGAASRQEPKEPENTDDLAGAGFGMFDEAPTEDKPATSAPKDNSGPKDNKKGKAVHYEKRTFTYTRQQWTGKSPKQFLIDWIRKHLNKSPPPSYKNTQVKGNLWRSRCRVMKKDEALDVCVDEIVCENVKEAEHLASTRALYILCAGQRVYQLLPPPYRDVWLQWQDKEDQQKQQTKQEENKPRDQFVSRLMKKLALSPGGVAPSGGREAGSEDDGGDTWEDLDTDGEEDAPTPAPAPRAPRGPRAERLRAILARSHASDKHRRLLQARHQLPVYQRRDDVIATITSHNVVVIAGETGSGKSTQIPQMLLEHMLETSTDSVGTIVCTQPRRISAVSLANRVSDEVGEAGPGTRDSLVGYQIRFESKRCDTSRLVYCTTGVVLRQLQSDPLLRDVSYIIVDEVHERTVQSDFLLVILRRLLNQRPDLHIVLMSATLDADKFSRYFQHAPTLEIPGRAFPVEVHHVEDVLEMTNYTLDSDSLYCLRDTQLIEEHKSSVTVTGKRGDSAKMSFDWAKDNISTLDLSDLDPGQYCMKTRNIVTRMTTKRVNIDLIIDLMVFLDTDPTYSAIDGAVLIFLPGLVHIQDLFDNLRSDRRFADESRYRIIPLHSVLSSTDQSAAFTVLPPGVRKVVLATNIAETGITIPDVVFVIDPGKVKENRYMEATQLSSLEEVTISQASAKQRQGRAGRVRDGLCFRLYTQDRYNGFKKYSVPEMLRVPLEELCLHIMKCGLGDPSVFLGQALDPPQPLALSRAMSILREVGACDLSTPTLTPLGHHLAALPVNVRVGKMLVYSAIFGCLEPVAIISASLTEKSPFVVPLSKRDHADVAKQSLATDHSDHLTLLKAFLTWKSARERSYQAENQVCQKFYLKRNSLIEINNIAEDLIKLVRSSGFHDNKKRASSAHSQSGYRISFSADSLNSKMAATIKSILAAGLYPNVAQVRHTPKVDAAANPERSVCLAATPQGHIEVHPSSVNRFLGANGWLVYHEKIKHGRPYIRDSSLVSAFPLLLFGGDIEVQHKDQVVSVDGWIKLKAYAKTAVIFKELRKLISDLLAQKIENPKTSMQDDPLVNIILDLVISDRKR